MATTPQQKEKRARWYCYKCYAEMDAEDEHNKPAAVSKGFQEETMAIMWELRTEIETLKDEVRKLRYHSHHNGDSNGGPFTN